MSTLLVSVVMPTYNQQQRLRITLESFAFQEVQGAWELILVDDGSEDNTPQMVADFSAPYYLSYIRCAHKGRAAARNEGLVHARGEIVILCDSDRAVCNSFIAHHARQHRLRDNIIVVGGVWEFYFSDLSARYRSIVADLPNDLQHFQNLARCPSYVKAVTQMFRDDGTTQYAMPWIAFFSGNVSIRADQLRASQAFDERFVGWGFEHFELGYRLFNAGLTFVYEPEARNYHFAHSRPSSFYDTNIQDSFSYFRSKHQSLDVDLLFEFLLGRISLQEYHNSLAQEKGLALITDESPVYYRQLAARQMEKRYASSATG